MNLIDGLTFKQWMSKVDNWLNRISGLSSSCLADRLYYDQYSDGISPLEAALECLEYNDFPSEVLEAYY